MQTQLGLTKFGSFKGAVSKVIQSLYWPQLRFARNQISCSEGRGLIRFIHRANKKNSLQQGGRYRFSWGIWPCGVAAWGTVRQCLGVIVSSARCFRMLPFPQTNCLGSARSSAAVSAVSEDWRSCSCLWRRTQHGGTNWRLLRNEC